MTGFLAIAGIISLIFVLSIYRKVINKKTIKNYMQQLSDQLGLTSQENGELHGKIENHTIKIRMQYRLEKMQTNWLIEMLQKLINSLDSNELVIKISNNIKIMPYTLRIRNLDEYQPSLKTGDFTFDANLFVKTKDPKRAFTHLPVKIRTLINNILMCISLNDISLTQKILQISCYPADVQNIQKNIIKPGLKLIESLKEPEDLDNRLLKNFKEEDQLETRIIYLRSLLNCNKDFKSTADLPEICRQKSGFFNKLTKDSDPSISTMACYALGENGIPKLIDKTGTLKSSKIKIAVNLLKTNYQRPEVRHAFYNLIKNADGSLLSLLLSIFSASNDYECTQHLYERLEIKPFYTMTYKLVKETLNFFKKAKKADSIHYIKQLLNDDNSDIQMLAIRTMGMIGSVAAVEYILPLTKGLLRLPDIKLEAKKAIQKLQKNIPRGEQGNLTIEDELQSGMLSTSDDDTEGGLSMEID